MFKFKKKFNEVGAVWKVALVALLFISLIGTTLIVNDSIATRAREYIYELHVWKVRGLTTDPEGAIDFNGTPVKNFDATDDIVYIDNVSDLSTWSGAAAGSSYFQMEEGHTYIVDLQAIIASGTAPTSGVSTVAFSGVTAHLPRATVFNSGTTPGAVGTDEQTVRVIYGHTSSSAVSDAPIPFTIQVWPAPDSGATTFRSNGYPGSQNMVGAASGTSVYVPGYTGFHNITGIGEGIAYILKHNSAVSAMIYDTTTYRNIDG